MFFMYWRLRIFGGNKTKGRGVWVSDVNSTARHRSLKIHAEFVNSGYGWHEPCHPNPKLLITWTWLGKNIFLRGWNELYHLGISNGRNSWFISNYTANFIALISICACWLVGSPSVVVKSTGSALGGTRLFEWEQKPHHSLAVPS